MKSIIKKMAAAAIAAITLTACYTEPSVITEAAETTVVQFTLTQPMTITGEMSRATPTEAGVGYIYVFDNETLVCSQTSTDEGFGSPVLSLTYGSHPLTFIASTQAYPTAGKVKDTFGYHYTLDVSASTTAQNLTLNRIITKLQMLVMDAIPADAAKVTIATKRYDQVNLNTLCGNHEIENAASVNIGSAAGQTGVMINTMFFCETLDNEWTQDVTVTFLRADETQIAQHTISDVPLKVNRVTQLKGNWFGTSNAPSLAIATDWEDTEVVNL